MINVNIVKLSDAPVIQLYVEIIQKACEEAGYSTCSVLNETERIEKHEPIFTDSSTVAIRYLLRGYRNQLVWFQGIVPEESFMRRKSNLRFVVLSLIEKIILKRAKVVFFVSEAMKIHYETKYAMDLSSKCIIMPCFNENGIVEDAFSQQKYKNNTFAYVGGLHVWQCFEETVQLYAEVEKRAALTTKFYIYTPQKQEAEEMLLKYGVRNFTVDHVTKDALSEYLKTIKYGFVLREDCAVNNVATPTKLSNYVANGIIPIYSPALRSFSEFDRNASIGIACEIDSVEASAALVLEHMKQDISASEIKRKCLFAFSDYYNKDKYIGHIAERLREIIGEA